MIAVGMPTTIQHSGGGVPWVGILVFASVALWFWLQFRGARRAKWGGRWERWLLPLVVKVRADVRAIKRDVRDELQVRKYRKQIRSADG